MPLSPKIIIDYLATKEKTFTKNSIIQHFIEKKIAKRAMRKGKKNRYAPQKDTAIISQIIDASLAAGLLQKKGKGYTVPSGFMLEGTLRINSTGHGMIESEDFGTIIVTEKDRGPARNNDTVRLQVYDFRHGFFHGRIIGMDRTGSKSIMLELTGSDDNFYYFRSIDFFSEITYKAPKNKEHQPTPGSLVLASLSGSNKGGKVLCSIIRYFPRDDESADFERIRTRHELPGEIAEPDNLPSLEEILADRREGDRNDFTGLYTITIDGEHAKDFDDALSLERTAKGFRLYVHVADVSAYVPIGSIEDRHAAERGTSYYIGNNVIPMFHEILSNNLCSLRADQDRPAMTAMIDFDEKGSIIDSRCFRSLIRVDKRLTYEAGDKLLTGGKNNKTATIFNDLKTLTAMLKQKRLAAGRLDLNLADTELIFEDNRIKKIITADRFICHSIIEESMLSANTVVSQLLKAANIPTLYRIHEPVAQEPLDAMKQFLKVFRIKIPKDLSPHGFFQSILKAVKGHDHERVVNYIILRSLTQAYYGIEPIGHFGLAFTDYAHFTSPIRRFPDLVVHRCLKAFIDGTPPPYTNGELVELGKRSSERERLAMKAERDMIKLKSCRLMAHRIGEVFEATISGITKNGFFVTIDEPPIEGMVPLRELTNDYYIVDEEDYSITGKRLGKRFRLGDKLQVRLMKADIILLRLDFCLP